ncbi:sensor histidine kinase [Franzmannia qiaohouensis]|uniref:histidine kinase n=1 Tax=Franzmannia qiaohouensis TaxID=1329370 RepID=A0ABU1HI65_9GAMM|nr:sensor histidine kinase N-terminal domain-containing protein [Halomonas qiaohouensis]MDR5907175.1 sensor histidine kinase N-terminal domain-containing protein [Halomonas qiaohouensis]
MRSIRARLLIWIGLPFTGLALLALLASHYLLSHQINETFDDMLLNAAERVERRIHAVDGELRVNMHYFSISTLGSRGDGKIFYRIQEVDGGMLVGFAGLEGPPDVPEQPLFYDVDYAGNSLRAVALTFPLTRANQSRQIEVIVAESTEARQALVSDFMLTLSGLMAVGGLLAISIALLAIHKGLAPLNAIRRALHRRSQHDLEPLAGEVPREVAPLIQSINQLMERMRLSIQNTQQLNADVSHQLRTPVSEIRALSELTLTRSDEPETRANLGEISRIAEHAGHTVEQLLRYAKTRHELVDSATLASVDLVAICRDACSQAAASVYQRGQELALEADESAPPLLGDPIMLRWMVQNLIDNASLHAGGEQAYRGSIQVAVECHDGRCSLAVRDDGVGVAEERLIRLTERFYRADTRTQGSGLGLAIAEQIAQAHGARLTLRNRDAGGLEALVSFPALAVHSAPAPSAASTASAR